MMANWKGKKMNTNDEKRNENTSSNSGGGFFWCILISFCIAMSCLSSNNAKNPEGKNTSAKNNKVSEFFMSLGFYPPENSNSSQNNYSYEEQGNDAYNDIEDYNYTYEQKLTPYSGTIYGPSGKETYYNLDMSYVCTLMQEEGFYYDYWVRDDGCKMYGPYIMVAADLRIRPKGTLIETSLGTAMVCDTGLFAYMYYYPEEDVFVPSYVTDPANSSERIYDPESYVPRDDVWYPYSYQIDIATTW